MNISRFKYVAPSNWDEALELLQDHQGAKLLAGGTDLMVAINKGKESPDYLIDLKQLEMLNDDVILQNGGLQIEALATIDTIARSALVRDNASILAQAAGLLGSWQVRNIATLGGNLCNASPAADLAPALLVLEALAEIQEPDGTKCVPICDFFTGPGGTVLGEAGILRRVKIPPLPTGVFSYYSKFTIRKSMDLPLVGVAVLMQVNEGVCQKARVALGAVAPTPMRAYSTEAVLNGNKLTEELLNVAAETAANECSPLSDIRASADYRREMIKIYTRRTLSMAIKKMNS